MEHKKFLYNDYEEDVIRLSQYIFIETDLSERHAIFNFHNQFTESVKDINFVVIQYDKNDEVLNRTKLKYDGFEAKGNTFFVPKVKLLILDNCERLDVYVEEATFDDYYLIDGVVHEITHDEEEIIEEDTTINHYFDVAKLSYVGDAKVILLSTVIFASLVLLAMYIILPQGI